LSLTANILRILSLTANIRQKIRQHKLQCRNLRGALSKRDALDRNYKQVRSYII